MNAKHDEILTMDELAAYLKISKSTSTSAKLGFEDKLWAAADKLRGNMDAAEYKHVVLGLIFLKYISDAFMEKYNHLAKGAANPQSEYYVKEERARYGVAQAMEFVLGLDDGKPRFVQAFGDLSKAFALPVR